MPRLLKRSDLMVATNPKTRVRHYVIKPSASKRSGLKSICGNYHVPLIGHDVKMWKPATEITATCIPCKSAWTKVREKQRDKIKDKAEITEAGLTEVKMLKTSDGKVFSMFNKQEAEKHEENIVLRKKKQDFIDEVVTKVFKDFTVEKEDVDTNLNEELFRILGEGVASEVEDLAVVMYELLELCGPQIRNIVILYQKSFGTFRLCRSTMLANNDIYL